jgi:hypothetical protein
MTGADAVKRALTKAGIRAEETPVTASEMIDGLELLNDMLIQWRDSNDGTSIIPDFVEVSQTEVINVPDICKAAIKSRLAILMTGEYGLQPSQSLIDEADKSMRLMRRKLVVLQEIDMDGILPRGDQTSTFGIV